MKKVKIMLTAVTIVAAVGGALAFKAQKFGAANAYCKSQSGACNKVIYQTTPRDGFNPIAFDPCANTTVYYLNPTCPVTTTFSTTGTPLYTAPNL
ncbi:hypothetical protein [Longitalea arenae]|uniref:hypothetical protein n=1 Tax=Longitalea arenae TaxID=2812558 RepID=UPI0019672C62|nr:hypothetical protein [Longitalea arenae]